jgi:hypothetical protein
MVEFLRDLQYSLQFGLTSHLTEVYSISKVPIFLKSILDFYDRKPQAFRYHPDEMMKWRSRARQFWAVYQQLSLNPEIQPQQTAEVFATAIKDNPIKGHRIAILLETVWVSAIKPSLKEGPPGHFDLNSESVDSFKLFASTIYTSLQSQPVRAAQFSQQLYTENELPRQLRYNVLNIPFVEPVRSESQYLE